MNNAQPDFNIWDFVTCAKCHLAFSSDPSAPPLVPFWLTSCGHVLCNNHISSDQNCTVCGEQRVQMVPLQREMDAPMSNWFGNVVYSLDESAHATKFQLEMMASLVRYYKAKASQHRTIMDRLKQDHQDLKVAKKQIDELQYENQQLRQYVGLNEGDPLDAINRNGKRSRMDAYSVYSSPRSALTPVGPNRLTLLPNQQQPSFAPRHDHQGGGHASEPELRERPGSSRYAQRYAYAPAQSPANDDPNSIHSGQQPPRTRNAMPPPPTPIGGTSRALNRDQQHFKPAPQFTTQPQIFRSSLPNNLPSGSVQPPSTRSHPGVAISGTPRRPQHQQNMLPPGSSNRFSASGSAPPQRFVPETPSGNSRRFMPPTSMQSTSRPSHTTAVPGSSHGSHRMQFGHNAPFV